MRNRRYTQSGREKARQDQIQEIRELASEAGYDGDRGYNAAADLLGDGRGWKDSIERADKLLAVLKQKLGRAA